MQIRQFGSEINGMPPVQVTKDQNGELMINDGVTRATRVAKLRPEAKITVEIIDDLPRVSFEHLPRVRERI
jgi:hypothetical protein